MRGNRSIKKSFSKKDLGKTKAIPCIQSHYFLGHYNLFSFFLYNVTNTRRQGTANGVYCYGIYI